MTEKPIIFSAPMVRAILEFRKTQTRRALKMQPPAGTRQVSTYHHPDPRPHYWAWVDGELADWAKPCPYGQPGDRLVVRETWARDEEDGTLLFRADDNDQTRNWDQQRHESGLAKYKWRPSIFMPRAASRITLEVVSVRVERLQDISEADARAEGLMPAPGGWWSGAVGQAAPTPKAAYALLWDSINAKQPWASNPFCWVLEFRRVTP